MAKSLFSSEKYTYRNLLKEINEQSHFSNSLDDLDYNLIPIYNIVLNIINRN